MTYEFSFVEDSRILGCHGIKTK